jgi:hypothetical protein
MRGLQMVPGRAEMQEEGTQYRHRPCDQVGGGADAFHGAFVDGPYTSLARQTGSVYKRILRLAFPGPGHHRPERTTPPAPDLHAVV